MLNFKMIIAARADLLGPLERRRPHRHIKHPECPS
jgi:hypothetical protein